MSGSAMGRLSQMHFFTGGARGIGRELVLYLFSHNHDVHSSTILGELSEVAAL